MYAVYTRGTKSNYRWSTPPALDFQNYLSGSGIAVYRQVNGQFAVFVLSEPTARTNGTGQSVRIGVLATDCSEGQTKGLAAYVLAHSGEALADAFAGFVRNGNAEQEWEADTAAVEHFLQGITPKKTAGKVFANRQANNNTAQTRSKLAAELSQYDFSPKSGLKLVIDAEKLSGSALNEVRTKVDRYLMKGGRDETLPDKEPKQVPQLGRMFWAAVSFALLFGTAVGGFGFAQLVYIPKMNTMERKITQGEQEAANYKMMVGDIDASIAEDYRKKGGLTVRIRELERDIEAGKNDDKDYKEWKSKGGTVAGLNSDVENLNKTLQTGIQTLNTLKDEVAKKTNEANLLTNTINQSYNTKSGLEKEINDRKEELGQLEQIKKWQQSKQVVPLPPVPVWNPQNETEKRPPSTATPQQSALPPQLQRVPPGGQLPNQPIIQVISPVPVRNTPAPLEPKP
ncbi:MAG: hypothetical protein LBT89_10820 [Planctomycetaceae bacterium]|jgi:hypothetical protein|nr:hypothetical protein [Planctomycetaceae bacterium]